MAVEGGEGQNPNGNEGGAEGAVVDGGWVSTLDPDLQKSPSVKKFKGKDWNEVGPQVLKSYVNLEKWQIPGEDADPEVRKQFARRRGVPEKLDDYKLDVKVPEGVEWTQEIEGEFAKFAHETGMTPSEATRVVNWYLERAGKGVDIQTAQTADELKKSVAALQQKWGASYNRNAGLVQREVEEYGSESFKTLLDTQVVDGVKLGNHPAMLEYLKAKGERSLEAGFITADAIGTSNDDAKAELDKILADQSHPYWQGDKEAVKKVARLFAILHPDQKRD